MADLDQHKPVAWKHIGLYGHAVGTFTSEFICRCVVVSLVRCCSDVHIVSTFGGRGLQVIVNVSIIHYN